MDNNYTPIDVDKLEHKESGLNTVLLFIVTLTALILAILLFVLIQKKISSLNTVEPTVLPTPTFIQPSPQSTEELITPTASATPTIETTVTPEASEESELGQ